MESEHTVLLPRGQVLVAYQAAVEVVVVDFKLGYLDLGVAAWDEVHLLAFGQLNLELFDERGHIAVGDDGAFVFLDAQYVGRDGNAHIFLDLDLAAQAPALLYLFAGEEACLGGQYASAAFQHLAAALAAAAFATAGRRQVDMLFGKGGYEAVAGGNGEFLVVVDGDGYVALRHQFGSQHQ